MPIVFLAAGPRSNLLMTQSYLEEGLDCPDTNEWLAPTKLLYPRSFVERVNEMPGEKTYDYCFVGGVYRPEIYEARKWAVDFARRRFTDKSYFLSTEAESGHTQLGAFDRTLIEDDVYVPKDHPFSERAAFHAPFYRVLRSSQFALCPAGDRPWAMRFFEALMCRSIPIVADLQHTGRNSLERSIGYRVYLATEEHTYDEEIVEENYQLFLRNHTLIEGRPDIAP